MILPGTLVAYVGGGEAERVGLLRRNGIYTVCDHMAPPHQHACGVCWPLSCDAGGITLQGVTSPEVLDGIERLPGFTLCAFRIVAKPLTVAEIQEATASSGDRAPAQKVEA